MNLKKMVIGLMMMCVAMTNNVYASDNDLLDEILLKQEERQERWENEVREIEEYGILGDRRDPDKVQCTCYIEAGKPTCSGSYKMDGIIATAPEHIGKVAQVYEVAEDGGIGNFIGYFEASDTGYGAPTGYGISAYKGRTSAGTIETGITIDFRKPNMKKATEFMTDTFTGEGKTGSQVYVIFEDGEG